jgi:hypothetical protein
MSAPRPDTPRHSVPTPDDLAGIPACKEEDNPTIRVYEARDTKGQGRAGTSVSGAPPGPPTPDDLAGIPVEAEGEEEVVVRPRNPPQQP